MGGVLTFVCQEPRPPPKSTDPAADYQEGASHVLSVIHEILAHHRQLESKWHTKKIKLHQRLALRLFQEDVKQVNNKICNKKPSLGTGSKYLFCF